MAFKGGPVLQLADYLGLAGGALVTCSMVPQIVRVFQLKSAREISMLFTTFLLAGMCFWLGYGVYLRLTQVMLWNTIGIILVVLLIYAKLKYGKQAL
jgi:MtN3 and saliva related transmembrane protein